MKELIVNEAMKPNIKNITIFKYLTEDELEQIMSKVLVYQYSDEEMIIKQGVVDQNLYAVLKGSVKVTIDSEKDDAYICTLGTSEIFGEAGLFINAPRTANVISSDKTIILKLTQENMLEFISKNSKASNKIFMIMIYNLLQNLKEANRELAHERKSDYNQADIDLLIKNLIGD